MPTLSLTSNRNIVTSTPSESLSPRVITTGGSLFLRSPTSPTGSRPFNVCNIGNVTENDIEVCPYTFRPPSETDLRGPCPALNTLANHGYLPRDGRDITRGKLLAALENPGAYHLSRPLAEVLVQGGFIMMKKPIAHSLSLHDLAQHGLIEHDASIVHKNTAPGHKYAPTRCDTLMLNDLLDGDSVTLEKVASRRVDLERETPLDVIHQEVARGEWALVLNIFGREHGGNPSSDLMRIWLKENRFPEGWRPIQEQSLADTVSKAAAIRKEMHKYRKDSENSTALAVTKKPDAGVVANLCGKLKELSEAVTDVSLDAAAITYLGKELTELLNSLSS